jgi:hypothetical protein
LVAAVDRFPGTKLLGEIPPGGTSSGNPEHASQNCSVIVVRATGLGSLGRQERGNVRPVLVCELEREGAQPLQRRTVERRWLVLCPSSDMTRLGHRLVVATKRRPGQPKVAALGWFGDREEQPTDFRYGQRKEVVMPPFSSAVACRRVTSR